MSEPKPMSDGQLEQLRRWCNDPASEDEYGYDCARYLLAEVDRLRLAARLEPALRFNTEADRDAFAQRLADHARYMLGCFDQGHDGKMTPSNLLINDLRAAAAIVKTCQVAAADPKQE